MNPPNTAPDEPPEWWRSLPPEQQEFFLTPMSKEMEAAFAQQRLREAAYIKEKRQELVSQHGAVPPPWIYAADSHPTSIMWRMGDGESYLMVFSAWWEEARMCEGDRVTYFKKWPPPPRWMEWMADAIWDLEPWEHEGEFDYAPYFARLQALGFEGVADFEADFNDEKWLRLEGEDIEQA